MNKIKKELIHWLGGFTENEYDNMCAISYQALTHLNEENKQLRENLRALEHAIEDSRTTSKVNVVRVEKPIRTFSIQSLIEENCNQTIEEQIIEAKRYMSKEIVTRLLKDNLIDFKVKDNCFNKQITGTIYVREP